MKFTAFKEFKGLDGKLRDISVYLGTELKKTLRDLQVGLTRLKFTDNFESFKTEVTIPAGAEAQISNELPSGETPTERIILRGGSGAESVVDGDTAWNNNFVYLQNLGGAEVTVTVLFLR